jgi:hypothetical protein
MALHDDHRAASPHKRGIIADGTIAELQCRVLRLTKVSDDMSMSELRTLYHCDFGENNNDAC